jgi:hypothetical protein
MSTLKPLPLFAWLSLTLAISGCSTGKGDYFRVGEFVTDTMLPPLGKLASNALAPFAGRTTHGELQKRFEIKDAEGNSQLGYFTGEPRIIPLGPHLFWFFQPTNPSEQFSFTTFQHSPYGQDTNGDQKWTIVPQSMLFDGASVPRFLWHVKSYGPFDFTKSAIIHDWLFEAHHRVSIYDNALTQDCSNVSQKERHKLERARDELAMYLERPVSSARDEHGSGRRKPTTQGLSCSKAGWIMMECMLREMKSSEALMDLTRQAMADAASNQSPAGIIRGNALRGLQKQIEPSLSISRERKHILGLYRFSVDHLAEQLNIWNPKPKRGTRCHSPHASSLAVLDAFSETIQADPSKWDGLLRLGQTDAALSPEILLLLDTDTDSAEQERAPTFKAVSPAVQSAAMDIQKVRLLLKTAMEVSVSNSNSAVEAPGR